MLNAVAYSLRLHFVFAFFFSCLISYLAMIYVICPFPTFTN